MSSSCNNVTTPSGNVIGTNGVGVPVGRITLQPSSNGRQKPSSRQHVPVQIPIQLLLFLY